MHSSLEAKLVVNIMSD